MDKSPDAFRTISEAAETLGLPQHVLRFWESRFPQIKPLKRGGGRRYYRPDDVEVLRAIKQLLYGEGYTIKGVQRLFKERGAKAVAAGALLEPGHEEFERPPSVSAAPGAPPVSIAPPSAAAAGPGVQELLRAALVDLVESERILEAARLA
jgi:DNA-binding transcriptional MerR regulator